ncbi:hypothetical protein AB0D11_38820 [Streptomyces monashensis]|uniref:hypothetical protein n=1 Tax=Streptomyces monashensis TaxID=1678012 RepID=UPI003405C95A
MDVAWATENAAEIGAADPHRTVRNTWAFEEFEPVTRYLHTATAIGFRLRLHDWSRPVTHWCKILGTLTSRIARTSAGRRLLALRWPSLRHLTTAQWDAFADTTEAHIAVAAHTRYIALVLDKPNPA